MKRLVAILHALSEYTGRAVAWLSLGMVLATFAVVVLRYALDTGAAALQEAVTYMHALVFMAGAAYTLKHDGHVRVDIVYRRLGARGQAGVDLLGALLLLTPVALYILFSSWDYVGASWGVRETSSDPGGLPWVYLLKSLIPLTAVLLLLQGLAQALEGLLVLGGLAERGAADAAGRREL